MVTPPDIEAQILRYYSSPRSGASAPSPVGCRVHHSVVTRVLAQAGFQDRPASPAVADRGVSAVHPPDAGYVSDADRQSAVCDGARARLSRQPGSLQPRDRLPSAASEG